MIAAPAAAAAAAAASEPCWNPSCAQETVWLLSGHYYFTHISSQTIVSDYSLLEAHSLFSFRKIATSAPIL